MIERLLTFQIDGWIDLSKRIGETQKAVFCQLHWISFKYKIYFQAYGVQVWKKNSLKKGLKQYFSPQLLSFESVVFSRLLYLVFQVYEKKPKEGLKQ